MTKGPAKILTNDLEKAESAKKELTYSSDEEGDFFLLAMW